MLFFNMYLFLDVQIMDVACGYDFTVCVDSKKKVWSWGANHYSTVRIFEIILIYVLFVFIFHMGRWGSSKDTNAYPCVGFLCFKTTRLPLFVLFLWD